MEEVKEFLSKHKKEIALVVGGVVLYRIGYRRGYRTALGAIDHLIKEVTNV